MKVYALPARDFRSLATGYGTPAALAVLAASQLAKRRLLIRAIVEATAQSGDGVATPVGSALALLQSAEAVRPQAVRAVLAHSYLDVWAAECLRSLPNGGPGTPHIRYLSALAAAAAIRAQMPFEVTLATHDGMVVVPTIGATRDIPGPLVRVRGDGAGLTFESGAQTVVVDAPYTREGPHWTPRREMIAVAPGHSHRVAIEDLDPYRDCFGWTPMARLTGAEAERMRRLYHEAWGLLCRDHPVHAAGIETTLRSLVPLAPTRHEGSVSATSSRAFGSLGLSVPEDPATFALLLIHEFQHMKLAALQDLVELCRPGGEPRYYAPWRPDARPATALLQGVYAHVGVVDFWRNQRLVSAGVDARAAEFEFAHWRAQTAEAAEVLLRSAELTELGTRFVAQLAGTLAEWRAEPVPPDVESATRDIGVANSVRWHLVHRRPAESDLHQLAEALRGGRSCPGFGPARPASPPPDRPSPDRPSAGRPPADEHPLALPMLLRARMTGTGRRPIPGEADGAYLEGRYDDAISGYSAQVERGDSDGWVGLAVVLGRLSRTGARVLADRPDLAHRLYRVAGGRATPVRLAEWLESRSPG